MYDQLASDYDRFNNWQNRLAAELPFIEEFLRAIPDPASTPLKVLDSACGTGMHAIALAARGYAVSGSDLSAPMIESARAHAVEAGLKMRFEAAGFGSLAGTFGSGSFDAVLCLGNSLPHLLTQPDLRLALKDFAACLRPGGKLLIQNRNFDAVMASRQRWMEPQPFSDTEHEWLFVRFYDFEPDGLIRFNMVTLKRPLGGEWQSNTASTRLAPLLEVDLVREVGEAGFADIQVFGSMGGVAFDPAASPNLVLSAAKV